MAKKYIPKKPRKGEEKKVEEIILNEENTEIILPIVEEEIIVETKVIPLVPVNAEDFCQYKVIIGTNLNFLKKKYVNKMYLLSVWEEILIKEKIN